MGCGCGGGGAAKKEFVVITAAGVEHVVTDRYQAINLVREYGGTWSERTAGQPSYSVPPAQ